MAKCEKDKDAINQSSNLFIMVEAFDINKFYVNRPMRFKSNNNGWINALVDWCDRDRIRVIYATNKRSEPDATIIIMQDVKDCKVEIELINV